MTSAARSPESGPWPRPSRTGSSTDPADVTRYLRSIGAETDRLALLVDDLFELSQIRSGVIDLPTRADPHRRPRGRCHRGRRPVRPEARCRARHRDRARRDRDGVADRNRSGPPQPGRQRGAPHPRRRPGRRAHVVGSTTRSPSTSSTSAVVFPLTDIDRVFEVAFRGDAARRRDDGGGRPGTRHRQGSGRGPAGLDRGRQPRRRLLLHDPPAAAPRR